jgi:23S rRNA (guanosine2251-2'-O)-methyltransferase
MVGGRKTRPRERELMGSHQRCWLWGRNVVLDTLRAGRWKPHELLHLADLAPAVLDETRRLADSLGIPLHGVTEKQLRDLIRAEDHQGLAARMPPYPYRDGHSVLETLPPKPFVLLLDGIQDPFNFGAILRSAEVLGIDAVFVAPSRQADVTAQVVRSSAGAVNHLILARVEFLSALAEELKSRGIRLWAASEKGERPPAEIDLSGPVALVIGNEGTGVSPEILGLCDGLLAIPQMGRTNSLNAAVAAGVLCYEVQRQRAVTAIDGKR